MKANLQGNQYLICRDCASKAPLPATFPKDEPAAISHLIRNLRCRQCGSPRLLYHPEMEQLTIAHIDCDAFYAAVEKRDNPELIDKPVIIGGGQRGVVSTACYTARIRGVRSAMPMFKALQACPDAVVIKPNMKKYAKVGHEIREMMRQLTPQVEPLSIDEAFLDLGGTKRLHKASAATVLARFAIEVQREIGISVSVGLSYCKFLAKIASDLDKPRGFSIIGEEEAFEFLRKQSVSIVWGVGKATAKMLAADGITKIAEVQDMEENELLRRYGSIGQRLSRLSHGRDTRTIEPSSGAKSISSETTFNTDKRTYEQLLPTLRALSEKVSKQLKVKHLAGQTVVLKLKTTQFRSLTRNRHLTDPTQLADRIFTVASQMLKRELDGTAYRLIGVGIASLQSDETADPEDLIDIEATKRAKAERAIDSLREKYGDKSVELGLTFKSSQDSRPQRDK